MLFAFRTLSFFVLGAILLTPVWLLNTRIDRLLPPAAMAPAEISNVQMQGRFVENLNSLRQEIRADMCRHDGRRLCLLTVCLPLEPTQCR